MNTTNYLPVIIRYVIVSLMAAMFTRGWLSPEHNAILGENLAIARGFAQKYHRAPLAVLFVVNLHLVHFDLWHRSS